jgi:energy-coupling factor transporter ATP-binding protein EcfA2
MLRPRIERVGLRYGCHDQTWQMRAGDGPLVIAGPNGSGKSTLLEGILAGLFGMEGRVPGAGLSRGDDDGGPWAQLVMARGDERFEIHRDLETGRVVVQVPGDDAVRFASTADAHGTTHEARRYRQLLTELLGVGDRETYVQTLFVRQGGLAETSLGEHLLRVAGGGHARVEVARREIAEAHRAVTARPLDGSNRPDVDSRELEKIEAEIRSLEDRLEAARAAGDRRGPLALDRDRMEERLRRLDGEIDRLEEAHSALARGTAIEVNARQLKELGRKMERALETIPDAVAEYQAARTALARSTSRGAYPEDFPERLARAELRWRDLDRAGPRAHRWPAVASVLLAVLAGVLLVTEAPAWPAVAAGAGALAAAAAWLALWLFARRTRAVHRAELSRILEGVPDGKGLGPDTSGEAAAAFAAQQAARRRRTRARADLAFILREGRALLRSAAHAGVATGPSEPGLDRSQRADRTAAEALLERLDAAVRETTERLLRERRELDRVGDASLHLPEGVVPTAEGVAEALRERRTERRQVQDALQEVGQELRERGTPAESLDALEAARATLLPQRDALARKADVLEAAHTLLTDSYSAFRAQDQERLLRLVSGHAERLTGGALGSLVVDRGLEDARVLLRGRPVPPRSPPLSFGEMHALLLGIRLGAADFLGGMGVFPPLILDDPFAHLDPERAALLWEMLRSVAGERQVILTTQDALLLDALGVEPDIRLGPERKEAPPETEPVPA